MMHGQHMLRAYSKTQSNIALSSGEAEYYAMVKAASESMGLKAMVADFQREIEPWLYVDATAAMGVAQRVGLGKIRHLETQSLWLQQAVRTKRVGLAKVLGTMNPADAMTKALDSNTMNRMLDLMGLEKREGRPGIAPMIEEADVNCVDEDIGEEDAPTQCSHRPSVWDGECEEMLGSLLAQEQEEKLKDYEPNEELLKEEEQESGVARKEETGGSNGGSERSHRWKSGMEESFDRSGGDPDNTPNQFEFW